MALPFELGDSRRSKRDLVVAGSGAGDRDAGEAAGSGPLDGLLAP